MKARVIAIVRPTVASFKGFALLPFLSLAVGDLFVLDEICKIMALFYDKSMVSLMRICMIFRFQMSAFVVFGVLYCLLESIAVSLMSGVIMLPRLHSSRSNDMCLRSSSKEIMKEHISKTQSTLLRRVRQCFNMLHQNRG